MARSTKRTKAKEIEVCSRCGQPLIEIPWGKSDGQHIYILTCDNWECPCYRNLGKTITKEAKYGQEQEQKQGKKGEKKPKGRRHKRPTVEELFEEGEIG